MSLNLFLNLKFIIFILCGILHTSEGIWKLFMEFLEPLIEPLICPPLTTKEPPLDDIILRPQNPVLGVNLSSATKKRTPAWQHYLNADLKIFGGVLSPRIFLTDAKKGRTWVVIGTKIIIYISKWGRNIKRIAISLYSALYNLQYIISSFVEAEIILREI